MRWDRLASTSRRSAPPFEPEPRIRRLGIRRAGIRAAALGLAAAGPGAACSTTLPHSVASAAVLSVTTGLWPLAQAATTIGGDKVDVVDVVPPGTDPFTYRPTALQTRDIRASDLVLEIGGGLQPGIEQAAAGAPALSRLQAELKTADLDIWLDPPTMARAVQAIAADMAAANPAAASLYDRNAKAFEAQVSSLAIDFSTTLSACPGRDLLTPDGAFSAMASTYGLSLHAVGPSPTTAQVKGLESEFRPGAPVAALSQPWVDDQGVDTVAAAAHLKVHPLDTLAAAPVGPASGRATFATRMEQDLGVISGALGCNASEQ